MSEVSSIMTHSSARVMPYPKGAGVSDEVVPSFADSLLGVLPSLGEAGTALPSAGFEDGSKESPSFNLTDSGTAQYARQLVQDELNGSQPSKSDTAKSSDVPFPVKLEGTFLSESVQKPVVSKDVAKALLGFIPDSILALLVAVSNSGPGLLQPIELSVQSAQDGKMPLQSTESQSETGPIGTVPDQVLGSQPPEIGVVFAQVPLGSKSGNGTSAKNGITFDDLVHLENGAEVSKPLQTKGVGLTLSADPTVQAPQVGSVLSELVLRQVVLKDAAKARLGSMPDSILAQFVGGPNFSSGHPESIDSMVRAAQDGKLPNQPTGAQFEAVDMVFLDAGVAETVSDQGLGSQLVNTDTARTQAQSSSKSVSGTPDKNSVTFADLVNLVAGTEVSKPLETNGGGQALRGDQSVQLKVVRAPGGKPLNDHASAKLEGTVLPAQVPQAGSVVSKPDVPPPMATTVDPEAVLRQVGRYLKVTLDGKHSEIRFQLHPDELGTVDVKLILHDGLVRAELTAQNSAVKAVLESNLEQLRSRLSAQGLNVDQLNVTVGSDLTGNRQQQENPREQRRKVPWSSDEDLEMVPDEVKKVWAAPGVDLSRRRINALV